MVSTVGDPDISNDHGPGHFPSTLNSCAAALSEGDLWSRVSCEPKDWVSQSVALSGEAERKQLSVVRRPERRARREGITWDAVYPPSLNLIAGAA